MRTCRPVLVSLALVPWLAAGSARGADDSVADKVESLIGPLLQDAMDRDLVPGTVVVVVHDGEVVLARGHGYANIERKEPVTDQTGFRVASVSKVLTALAVNQLVERGVLRLDDPVQDHLDFPLENPFDEPVTLRHLLTHSAGLDRRSIGQRSRSREDMQPLGEYLRDKLPPVIRPPGEIFAYSNHGFALAGYLVERASGRPFEDYARDQIFKPLDMDHTSFEIDAGTGTRLATGYQWRDDAWHAVPLDYPMTTPSSSLVTTGADMTRLLTMLLGGGAGGDARILGEAALEAMQTVQFRNHDALDVGYGFGFFVRDRADGSRRVWHDGDFRGWSAHLELWPEQRAGMFMASNTPGGFELHRRVADALNRLIEPPDASEVAAAPPADFTRTAAAELVGTYGYVGTSLSTIDKMNLFPGVGLQVSIAGDAILIDGAPCREVAPLVFEEMDGTRKRAFLRDSHGRIAYLTTGTRAYFKMKWYELMPVHAAILLAGAACALSTLVWPLSRLWRRPRKRQGSWMRAYAFGVWLLYVAFFAGLFFAGRHTPTDYGVPPTMAALFVMSTAGAMTALGLPLAAAWAWRERCWNLAGRIHYSVVAIGALAFAWMLFHWNLVGFQF